MCTNAYTGQRHQIPVELESNAVRNYQMWVLQIELGCSARALISTEPSIQPQILGVFQLEEIDCARKNWDKD